MHYNLGVILKKENIEKEKESLRKIIEFKSEQELEFDAIALKTREALLKYLEPDYYEEDENEEVNNEENFFGYLDWYVIGGRWMNCLPLKPSVKKKKLEFNNTEADVYYNDYMSYAQIKDIDFKKAFTDKELKDLKDKYDYEKKQNPNSYFSKKFSKFEDYISDIQSFSTNSFLSSNDEWTEVYNYNNTVEETTETFFSLLEKEDEENYFVLVDCHI